MMRLGPLEEEEETGACLLATVWEYAEKLAVCLPGEASPKFQSAGIWIWDFPTSRADKK